MKINCIIVDDEPLAAQKLKQFINKVDSLELSGVFTSGVDAMNFIREDNIDLIFLDIEMPEFTGVQLLQSISIKSRIIITSAYPEYALLGYELNITDYLLKPFTFSRFMQAFGKASNEIINNQSGKPGFIFIKTEFRLEKILLVDILFVEGKKDYLSVVCHDKKIMTLMSFSEITQLLPANQFARIHKSYIVAISGIKSIEKNRITIGSDILPISDTYKAAFVKLLQKENYLL